LLTTDKQLSSVVGYLANIRSLISVRILRRFFIEEPGKEIIAGGIHFSYLWSLYCKEKSSSSQPLLPQWEF